jgi:hypothetical protein
MQIVEFQLRLIEGFLVACCGPIIILRCQFPHHEGLADLTFVWQGVFMICMVAIKVITGLDPITEPTAFDSLIELYLRLLPDPLKCNPFY